MGDLEEQFLKDCSFKPLIWQRYIDDIFQLWQSGKGKLKESLDVLHCYHPSTKFTRRYSREQIDNLDVEIIKKDSRLLTDLFAKSPSTHQYLNTTFCHVYHSYKYIAQDQTLRFNRICSKNQFFDKRYNDLKVWLKNAVTMRSS